MIYVWKTSKEFPTIGVILFLVLDLNTSKLTAGYSDIVVTYIQRTYF